MFLFTVVLEINVYLIVFHDARVRLISCGNRNVSIASLRQATRSKFYMSLMTVVCLIARCHCSISFLIIIPTIYPVPIMSRLVTPAFFLHRSFPNLLILVCLHSCMFGFPCVLSPQMLIPVFVHTCVCS